jgi:hypothetical protein
MRKALFGTWFLVLAWIVAVPVAVAKGAPDKITISGGGLAEPITITDRTILADWSPWGAKFIDWGRGTITEPPSIQRSYDVFFYLGDHLIYAVQYAPALAGERGYIYLPGPQDRWYKLNIGTIIQDGHDGNWHYASSGWDAQMPRLLHQHTDSASKRPLMPKSGMALQMVWAVGLGATGLIAAGVLLTLGHRRHTPASGEQIVQ